jgi:hypothetical protein
MKYLDLGAISFKHAIEITNSMHRFAPLLIFMCWLLHFSAVVRELSLSELHENTDRYGGLSYNVGYVACVWGCGGYVACVWECRGYVACVWECGGYVACVW